jgi:hypothetical protein
MPFVNKHIRYKWNLQNPLPTIPQIFYLDQSTLFQQIINNDLYQSLLLADLPWLLLDSGDFLIQSSIDFSIVQNQINSYYGLPPIEVCKGMITASTNSTKIISSKVATLETQLSTLIIPFCAFGIITTTFVETVNRNLYTTIEVSKNSEIL